MMCFTGGCEIRPHPMHHVIISSSFESQEICQLPKFCTNKFGGNGIMVDPSAHPQHMNGLKDFVYVWSGCGNYSMWVWGINHCTLISFVALHCDPGNLPIPKIRDKKYGGKIWWKWKWHDGGSIYSSTANEWSQTHVWIWGLTQCTMASFVTPLLPRKSASSLNSKLCADKYGGRGMMVGPSIHPQHMNV